MKKLRKILTVALAAAMVTGAAVLPASATVYTDQELAKISNPDKGQREADGLVPQGDRETSYAWCMAARGDYVYIGTNKNIVGSVVDTLVEGLTAMGITADQAWALADVMMNGEIPRPTTTEGGQILRVDCKTNEISIIYTAPAGTSFRMAYTHGDNVYFGSYSVGADDSFTTDTQADLSNDIFCTDADDNVTKVFSSSNGTSMRAACEFEGHLFFGGVDASLELSDEWKGAAKLAILEMDEDDNTKWSRVADYEDFGMRYAKDPAMTSAAASPVWDICEYNGDLYATIPNVLGFAVFKGHPAKDGETANKYGWVWEEVVGFNNTYGNPIGLNPDASVETAAQNSVVATPVVFKGELYLFDFDNTIGSINQALTGMLQAAVGQDVKASDYLRKMYNTLRHTQSLWKLDNATGKFEKVEGFTEFMENTTNEYVWRAEVYNDQLYLTTMDSAVLYNGITRLTNTSFVDMTAEEWKDQIVYLVKLAEAIDPALSEKTEQAKAKLEAAITKLKVLYAQLSSNEDVQKFVAAYAEAMQEVQEALAVVKAELADNIFVQQLIAKLFTIESAAKTKYAELCVSVRDYIKSHDLSSLLVPDPDASPSTISEEELMTYVNLFKTNVGVLVESLRIKFPELRAISRDELKEIVSQYMVQLIDKTVGQELYAAIVNFREAFDNRADEVITDLKIKLATKLVQYYSMLPEEKQEKISALVQKYVLPTVDKIEAAYLAQLEKVAKFKETLQTLSQTTFEQYQAMFDEMIDIAAAQTEAEIQHLNEVLNTFGLQLSDEVKEKMAADIAAAKEACKEKVAETINKLTPDTSLNPIQAAQYGLIRTMEELEKSVNKDYYKVKAAYDKIDWEGFAMYAYINDMVKNDTWGFDMVRTADGENFELVTDDGFNDKYNYGGRSMVATPYGLYVGTANPFYGAQLFRLTDPLQSENTLAADTITFGEEATVNLSSTGGVGQTRYTVLYRKAGSTKWTMAAHNTTDSTVSFTPQADEDYEVRVLAKDNNGTVVKQTLNLKVTRPLTNDSRLSAESITLGEKLKVRAIARGGDGDYQYAVYYKKASSEKWVTVSSYGDKYAFYIIPQKAMAYDVRVCVKDGTGKEEVKEMSFNVTPAE